MNTKRIVTIHAVDDYTLKQRKLILYIKIMQKLGYKFISIDEILSTNKPGKFIALTVDDAYKSCIKNLLPILDKYNVPAMLFVPTGLLGKKSDDIELKVSECYQNQDIMSIEDIELWLNKGHQIGFHTNKHIDLFNASDNIIIKEDFIEGINFMKKQRWETSYFAYPKGFLPQDRLFFEELMIQNNITYAFTINWGSVNCESPFYINRVCLGNKENIIWSILKSIGFVDSFFYKKRQHKEQKI